MKIAIPVSAAAALVLLAGPAFAGHSTPKEREATRQLNLEAAQQAKNANPQIASANVGQNVGQNIGQSAQTPAENAPIAAPTSPVETAPAAERSQDASPQPASPAQ